MNTLARFLGRHPVLFVGVLIAYVLFPMDFFPEALAGPLGYLDDILLVAAGLLLRRYGQSLKDKKKFSANPPIDTTAE